MEARSRVSLLEKNKIIKIKNSEISVSYCESHCELGHSIVNYSFMTVST